MLHRFQITSYSISFWRRLTNFWTAVFFAVIIYDFLSHNSLHHNGVILGVAAIYAASLAIYSAEKEFKRWKNKHNVMHPGEIYIILWTLLVVGLIVCDLVFHMDYHMPPEVSSSFIVVLGILAITKESKHLYKRKKK
ncbi:MAG: hypothetical protein V4526_00375 [Patescibacteria group bacterium]